MTGFIYFDTETTGFSRRDRLVEIALAGGDGQILFQSLINPGMRIPGAAMAVHGITDAMVSRAPAWHEIESKVVSLVRGCVVVGHNVAYDLRFTGDNFRQAFRESVCTMKLARREMKRPVKLEELAKLAGYRPDGKFHRAAADALATRAGHLWLLDRSKPKANRAARDERCRVLDSAQCPAPVISGAPWDKAADARLSALWNGGFDVPDILNEMPRTPRAIFARLERLGHIAPEHNPYPIHK